MSVRFVLLLIKLSRNRKNLAHDITAGPSEVYFFYNHSKFGDYIRHLKPKSKRKKKVVKSVKIEKKRKKREKHIKNISNQKKDLQFLYPVFFFVLFVMSQSLD